MGDPEIIQYEGILTSWQNYPAGSIERAKSLGGRIWDIYRDISKDYEYWSNALKLCLDEKIWEPLGLSDFDEFFVKLTGKTIDEAESLRFAAKRREKEAGGGLQHREDQGKHGVKGGRPSSEPTQSTVETKQQENPPCNARRVSEPTKPDQSAIPSQTKSETKPKYGTKDYWRARFVRDIADQKLPGERREQLEAIVKRIEAGEISMSAGAIQAGYRKQKSDYDRWLQLTRKLVASGRHTLVELLGQAAIDMG